MKCAHKSKYADWNDKYIPYGDRGNFKGIPLTKYWQVKCNRCKQYIPEYGFKYPVSTFR